jgi:hypothetical protein
MTSGLDFREAYEFAPLRSSVIAMLYTREPVAADQPLLSERARTLRHRDRAGPDPQRGLPQPPRTLPVRRVLASSRKPRERFDQRRGHQFLRGIRVDLLECSNQALRDLLQSRRTFLKVALNPLDPLVERLDR